MLTLRQLSFEIAPMIDKQSSDPRLSKLDPHDWKTGDEPMTAAQRSYLETLTREAGEDLHPDVRLTKAEAALRIEELQARTGRGGSANSHEQTDAEKRPAQTGSRSDKVYRDRPTDDGKHGDGGADPSGVSEPSRR